MRPATIAAGFLCAVIFCGIFFIAAMVRGAGVTGKLSVAAGSATPVVSSVAINNNAASITLTPNTTTNVNVTASVSDNDGCSNITGGTTTILLYRSGVTSSSCLTGSGNGVGTSLNCYLASAFTASSTCSGTSSNTTTTFAVQYYAQATDASSSFVAQNWQATIIFTDPTSLTGSADSTSASTTADVATLLALNLPTSTINYGSLAGGANTGATNQLLNVENSGNASDTVAVNGTALTFGGNVIATSSQHYATSSFTYGGVETPLAAGATTITGILTAPVFNFPIGGAGWTTTQALTYTIKFHTSLAYNGYLYTIGGFKNGGTDASTVSFAPINATGSIGAWINTTALPYTDITHASAAYGSFLYTLGGAVAGVDTSTVLFAPISATGSIGAWTKTTALPYIVEAHTAVAYNGFLYAIGGHARNLDTSTVLFAPINATGSIGVWTSTAALPYILEAHTSIVYNGFLYAIGGSGNGADTSTVVFAPINVTGSLGAWTKTTALPYVDLDHSSAAYNGYLYTIGGLAAGAGATSTVVAAPINATGSIGAWVNTQVLPFTDIQETAGAYNGYLYMIGGNASGTDTSTVLFTPLNARSTYWGLAAGNIPAGSYTGTVTFTASYSP